MATFEAAEKALLAEVEARILDISPNVETPIKFKLRPPELDLKQRFEDAFVGHATGIQVGATYTGVTPLSADKKNASCIECTYRHESGYCKNRLASRHFKTCPPFPIRCLAFKKL